VADVAKTRPVHQGETVDTTDTLAGTTWVVEATHHGHTMTVVGRIHDGQFPTAMNVVRCSCGDEFRMSDPSIAKAAV